MTGFDEIQWSGELLPKQGLTCRRFVGNDGYLVCDYCGSIWSPLLHGSGWLPLSCPERVKSAVLPSTNATEDRT